MCCWPTGGVGRLKTQEVKCPVSKRQKTRPKKLGPMAGKYEQQQDDLMLLRVGESMSAPKKGPLGRADFWTPSPDSAKSKVPPLLKRGRVSALLISELI